MTETSGHRNTLGRSGEDLAVRLLQSKGYAILKRNFRALRGEIDIIARDKDTLVFVEVKTGSDDHFGDPESWVDWRKQRQLGKVAQAYLTQRKQLDAFCRFDVIAVMKSGDAVQTRHIVDAFWL